MTIWQEARRAIRGVLRLARFDPDALEDFNVSLDGYWRSFFAAALLLPLYLIVWLGADVPGKETAVPLGRRLLIEGINYPLAWTLWPLVVFYIARAAGWGERYIAYIVAYNWTQIFSQGVMLLFAILFLPTLEPAAQQNLWLLMLFAFLVFEAYVAKRTLNLTWFQAGAVEALLFVILEAEVAVKDFVLLAH
jgi:hypothetical protein